MEVLSICATWPNCCWRSCRSSSAAKRSNKSRLGVERWTYKISALSSLTNVLLPTFPFLCSKEVFPRLLLNISPVEDFALPLNQREPLMDHLLTDLLIRMFEKDSLSLGAKLIAHLSLPWSIGWVALTFLVRRSFVRLSPRYVNIWHNLHFFPIYTGIKALT